MNTCPTCNRVFKTPQGLAGHIQFKHTTAPAVPAAQRPAFQQLKQVETPFKADWLTPGITDTDSLVRFLRQEAAANGGTAEQLHELLSQVVEQLKPATAEPVDVPEQSHDVHSPPTVSRSAAARQLLEPVMRDAADRIAHEVTGRIALAIIPPE